MKRIVGITEDGREVVDDLTLDMENENGTIVFRDNDKPFSGVTLSYNHEGDFPEVITEVENGLIHGYYGEWSDNGYIKVSKSEHGETLASFSAELESDFEKLSREAFVNKMKIIDPSSLLIFDGLAAKILGNKTDQIMQTLISGESYSPITSSFENETLPIEDIPQQKV
jgi:hypothetical protein